jgi:uncharacterized protein YegL
VRRLPVYLLLDTSGSMRGEPIEAVRNGIMTLVSALRQDPHALETVHLSIITFDVEAKVLTPLTAIDVLQVPEITTPRSGPTHLGQALQVLETRVRGDVVKSSPDRKGDWAPILFVMTDGRPSDLQLYRSLCPAIRALGFADIIGCVAGPKVTHEDLRPLCNHIVALDTLDFATFAGFFRWVTSTIAGGNRSLGAKSTIDLPPPPPEIQVVY